MNEESKKIGIACETIAANYLQQKGYEILDTNFSNELGYRRGEIDVVARDPKNKEIVFVEVKTRKKNPYSAQPELAINQTKYRKLSKIISSYLRKNKLLDSNYRLDAIAIELDIETKKAKLRHLKYIYY